MPSIQFGGVVSGLNTQSIVDALVAAEKQPLTALQTQEPTSRPEIVVRNARSAIDDLIAKVKAFTVTSAGASRSASSTDSSILTATASTSAAVATYQVSVDRLATATRAGSTAAIGAGIAGAVDTSQTLVRANLAARPSLRQYGLTVDGRPCRSRLAIPPRRQSRMSWTACRARSRRSSRSTDPAAQSRPRSWVASSSCHRRQRIGPRHQLRRRRRHEQSGHGHGLKTQGVTATQNATITSAAYLDPTIASLNLPGNVTAGQISAIVDGTIVHYHGRRPTATTLDQMMAGSEGNFGSAGRRGANKARMPGPRSPSLPSVIASSSPCPGRR